MSIRDHPAGDPDGKSLRGTSLINVVNEAITVITTRLAHAGISVNPVSAFHQDHLFVPWEKKERALEVLIELSRSR